MKTMLIYLALALFVLSATPGKAAEPTDLLLPDGKDTLTESVTKHGVTLTLHCPKVLLPGMGNYILITVRNQNEQPVDMDFNGPQRLGVDFLVREVGSMGRDEIVGNGRNMSLGFGENMLIGPDEEFKALIYPTRHFRFPLYKPGRFDMVAFWSGSLERERIDLETKPLVFENKGIPDHAEKLRKLQEAE